ncbi:MAG: hypothetical protein HC929_19280, partial [Leptolyngbyaceae cyanobacterium SM2_5_2]|nr:hypothetical protein [Leptolyngbyaceae cyanobacterium SM2_5_2]
RFEELSQTEAQLINEVNTYCGAAQPTEAPQTPAPPADGTPPEPPAEPPATPPGQ